MENITLLDCESNTLYEMKVTKETFDRANKADPMVGGQKELVPDPKQDSNLDETPFPESGLSFDEDMMRLFLHDDVNSTGQSCTTDELNPSENENCLPISGYTQIPDDKPMILKNIEHFEHAPAIEMEKTSTSLPPQNSSMISNISNDDLEMRSSENQKPDTLLKSQQAESADSNNQKTNEKFNTVSNNISPNISTDSNSSTNTSGARNQVKVQKIPASKYAPPKKPKNNDNSRSKKPPEKAKQSKRSVNEVKIENLNLNIESNHFLDMPQLLSPTECNSTKKKSMIASHKNEPKTSTSKIPEAVKSPGKFSEEDATQQMQYNMYDRIKETKTNAATECNSTKKKSMIGSYKTEPKTSKSKIPEADKLPGKSSEEDATQQMQYNMYDRIKETKTNAAAECNSTKKKSMIASHKNEPKTSKSKIPEADKSPGKSSEEDATQQMQYNMYEYDRTKAMKRNAARERNYSQFYDDTDSSSSKNNKKRKITSKAETSGHSNSPSIVEKPSERRYALPELETPLKIPRDAESAFKPAEKKVNHKPIPNATVFSKPKNPYETRDLDSEFDKLKNSGPPIPPKSSSVKNIDNRYTRTDRILRSAQEAKDFHHQVPLSSSQHGYSDGGKREEHRRHPKSYRKEEDLEYRRKYKVQERPRSSHSRSSGYGSSSNDYRREPYRWQAQADIGKNDWHKTQPTSEERRRFEGHYQRDSHQRVDRWLKRDCTSEHPPSRPSASQSQQKSDSPQGDEWFKKLDELYPIDRNVY